MHSQSLLDIVRSRRRAHEKHAQSPLHEAARTGQLPALAVDPTLDRIASEHASNLVAQGLVSPESTQTVHDTVLDMLRKGDREGLEAAAAQAERGMLMPVSPGEVGLAAGAGVALPWAVSRAGRLIGRTPKNPLSLRQSALLSFGPKFLPAAALFEALGYGLSPLTDPAYQRGERSLPSSIYEGMKGSVQAVGQRGQEARERYGALGIPVQALHGILNPMSSIAYMGGALKDFVFGTDGKQLAQQAGPAVQGALEP